MVAHGQVFDRKPGYAHCEDPNPYLGPMTSNPSIIRVREGLPTILPRLLRTPFLARGRQLSGNPTSRALT
jgi:hypothetical protein